MGRIIMGYDERNKLSCVYYEARWVLFVGWVLLDILSFSKVADTLRFIRLLVFGEIDVLFF